MTVQAPVPRTYWILAGLLCLLTLVALWAVAWRIRERKVEARGGGRRTAPSETDRPRRLPVARGKTVHAGHFKLGYPPREGALMVLDPASRPLVTFTGFAEGQVRGWQELRVTCVAADATSYVVDVEFRPGAPCLGPGEYAALKPGLRIELDAERALTVVAWDPAKPELRLSGPAGEVALPAGGELVLAPFRARLVDRALHVLRD